MLSSKKKNFNKDKKNNDYDDGRVIAPMNIDGMPWYNFKSPNIKEDDLEHKDLNCQVKMSRIESFRLILSIYKIIIPLSLVLVGIMAGVIAFIAYVWLK